MRKIKQTLMGIASFGLAFFAAQQAVAHTISVGTYNAGSPGSVAVTLGSYHIGGGAEGAIQLISGLGTPSAVVSFSNLVTVKPTELVDGVNNFFAPSFCCSSPAGTFDQVSNTTGQTVDRWQTAVFTGLSAGDYTYQISGMNSQIWEDWSSLTNNWQGSITISNDAIGAVPLPAGLPLLLAGIGGLGVIARRRRTAN